MEVMSPPAPVSPRQWRVLVVCTGNICRSAMAQQVLDEDAAAAGVDMGVDSAGISDEEHGRSIDPRAARALREAGHRVPDHRARRVRGDELGTWDLVLAMTRSHLTSLQRLAARGGVRVERNPVPGTRGVTDLRLFRDLDPDLEPGEDPDVPDPWYGDHTDFVETLEVIERVSSAVVDHILQGAR